MSSKGSSFDEVPQSVPPSSLRQAVALLGQGKQQEKPTCPERGRVGGKHGLWGEIKSQAARPWGENLGGMGRWGFRGKGRHGNGHMDCVHWVLPTLRLAMGGSAG